VLIPRGNVALGKLAQALVHGARVLEIAGNFDRALQLTTEMSKTHPITLVNSVNPYRVEGQKSGDRLGTGLGLAIVKHLVEAHDGVLDASSEPGKGTRIAALFPNAT